MKECLFIVEAVPYKNFKEKINITKKNLGKGKMEVHKNIIYIERTIKEISWT